MLNRKTVIAFISVLAAVLIISCGGGAGGGNSGEGGPDVSPDNITETGTGDTTTTTIADSTTNTELTGTTTSDGEVVVEPEVNTTIEGKVDTGSDTGTTTASGSEDTAGKDTTDSVTNNTESDILTNDIIAILTGGEGFTTSEGTGTATSEGTGSATSEGTGTTTSEGTGTTTSEGTGSTTSEGTGSTTSEGTGSTTSEGTASDEDTAIAAGTGDSGAGNTIEDLENDEDVDQGKLDYSIDSSLGKWYQVAEGELVSDQTADSIKSQIAQLRAEIKAIKEEFQKGKSKRDEAVARIKALRKKIADLRASVGNGGNKKSGIYTAWANQNLYLNIRSGEPGWYRLVIVAKNQGTLPDDYDRFSFSVEQGSDSIASISVKASDKAYFRGSAIIKLDQMAGTQLNILWKNDAYLKDKYDANVNIKKIALIKIKEPKHKIRASKQFKGDQYSVIDGRWFFDKNDAYTYWSDQVIGYTFKNMEEGQYEVTIEAMNHGSLPLPKNYKEFQVEVDSEYDSATVAIPASEKHWGKETFTLNFPEGDSTVYLTWVNDSFKENSYDANIKIKSIKVKKIKQSNLTAYLLKTKPGNRVFILSAFLMISVVLLGIYMKNRKSEAGTL